MEARTDFCILDPATLSERPSQRPSISPTEGPTASMPPTDVPTHSSAPTKSPSEAPTRSIVAIGPFQLKLHWTRKSCWTGSGNEIPNCNREVTKWCMQCEGHICNVGDILWVEPCRDDAPPQQLFQYFPSRGDWGQLQIQHEESGEWLCLQRKLDTQNHTLQACNDDLPEQLYGGFQPSAPFELQATTPEKVLDNCLTMPHHPRQFEEIIHASCRQSRKDRTSQWKALWPNVKKARAENSFNERSYYRLGPERTSPRCSEDRRCGMCQGHCESHDDCNGSLRCFQRGSSNPRETPPGCYGDGVSSKLSQSLLCLIVSNILSSPTGRSLRTTIYFVAPHAMTRNGLLLCTSWKLKDLFFEVCLTSSSKWIARILVTNLTVFT